MRNILLLLLTLTSLAAADEKLWNAPHQPFHVVGDVYYVGTAGIGVYLIATPKGDILIDGALAQDAPLIEKNIRALGFKLRDVKYLLNTHAHYDHCGGLAALKRDTGAQMVASQADALVLEAGKHGSYGAGWGGSFPAVKVDRIVHDGDTVQLGGVVLTAVLTPGHTKGCTTWLMNTNGGGHSLSVVFYGSTTVPGYPLVHNADYRNIVSDYESSFAKLKKLHADVFLANHAEFFDMEGKLARVKPGAPNPFIDPSEFPNFVAHSEADFNQKLAKQTAHAQR